MPLLAGVGGGRYAAAGVAGGIDTLMPLFAGVGCGNTAGIAPGPYTFAVGDHQAGPCGHTWMSSSLHMAHVRSKTRG
jgi:hypothetical protein